MFGFKRKSAELKKLETEKKNKLVQFYMSIAKQFSQRSKDPRLKVGCVIVTTQGIIYPGYNGDEIGGTNKQDSAKPGMSGFVHAEANALIKYD